MKKQMLFRAALLSSLFIFQASSAVAADEIQPKPSAPKKVAVEVLATLHFTECVAKLLNKGLGASEARQLCLDTVSN
jgi:hypothetical protein